MTHLVGDWLLEGSVLLAVFPIIDQLVATTRFNWRLVLISAAISLLAGAIGVSFRRKAT